MIEGQTPVKIFCSYAHEDEMWLRKLETHLSLLKRQGLISFWHDRLIAPGTDWARTIDTHLETASVILLLVSADFFASDYCYGIEVQRALAREAAGEARVIPILIRPVDWTTAPFAHLQSLPTDARPIVSWQSTDTALADIVGGIRRVIVEELPQLPVSAPRAALPKIWNIPYPRNPFFLGRDAELLHIRQHLQTGQATALSQPQAISGLGGIGKTQLALEYAYRYHQDYQTVLWAHAESTEALISSYITFATLLHLPEWKAKEQDIIIRAVRAWLQTHHGWLLVLDNADELKLLLDFLPPSLGGHLLLTTRASATGRLAHRLEIETLERIQGALFLLRRAALLSPDVPLEQASSQEQELALQISQELGGLPLALDQAGAYLEETGTDLAEYWHLYQQHRADLLRERRGLVADHPSPVATTWLLSFQKVKEKNPAAADLLQLCAYLAPDAIPEEVLTTGAVFLGSIIAPIATNALLFHQAIEALRAYSLVQRDSRQKLLSVHRLVQAVLCNTLPAETHRQWIQHAVRAVSAVFPSGEFKTWPACERLLPHALVCIDWIKQEYIETPEAARLLQQVGYYLTERGHYAQAEPLCQRALAIRDRVLGSEHSDIIFSLNNLAFIYRKQGKYTEAASLCQRALVICERVLGLDHPETAGSLNNLADLYYNQEKYAEAEPLYQRALAIYERTLGPEDLDTATILWDLADLYGRQGKYDEAEPLYQRALSIREQAAGPEHPDTAEVLSSFALLREAQGNKDEARSLYIRALAIREKALGMDHRKTMETRKSLITLLQTMEQYEEAAQLEAAQSEL